MAAHELGKGMNDNVGSMFNGPQQDRGRHRVVDDQRNAMRMRSSRDRPDVADIARGIADTFAKDRARRLVDQGGDILGSIARGEPRLDVGAPQRMGEQRVRRAVELRRRDDASSTIGERQEGGRERGLAGGQSQRGDASLEHGDAFLEHLDGRVRDPAVPEAWDFQIEHRRGLAGSFEFIGDVLIDRRRHRPCGGVASEAAVNKDRFEPHRPAPAHSLKSLPADTSGSFLERTKHMAFSATIKEALGVIAQRGTEVSATSPHPQMEDRPPK